MTPGRATGRLSCRRVASGDRQLADCVETVRDAGCKITVRKNLHARYGHLSLFEDPDSGSQVSGRKGADISPGLRWGLILIGSHPIDPNIGPTAKEQYNLCGMVLGVTKIIEEEFADVEFIPPEAASLLGTLLG